MTSGTLVMMSPEELQELVRGVVRQEVPAALAQHEVDSWLDNRAASRYHYGVTDNSKVYAWGQLRRRHPEIDQASVGVGRLRRWKRSALDQVLTTLRPARAQGGQP